MLLPLHNNLPNTPPEITIPDVIATFVASITTEGDYSNSIQSNKNIDSSIDYFMSPSKIRTSLVMPSKVTFNRSSPHLFENNLH